MIRWSRPLFPCVLALFLIPGVAGAQAENDDVEVFTAVVRAVDKANRDPIDAQFRYLIGATLRSASLEADSVVPMGNERAARLKASLGKVGLYVITCEGPCLPSIPIVDVVVSLSSIEWEGRSATVTVMQEVFYPPGHPLEDMEGSSERFTLRRERGRWKVIKREELATS